MLDYVDNEYGKWGALHSTISERRVWYRIGRETFRDPEIVLTNGKYEVRKDSNTPSKLQFDTLELAMLTFALMYG